MTEARIHSQLRRRCVVWASLLVLVAVLSIVAVYTAHIDLEPGRLVTLACAHSNDAAADANAASRLGIVWLRFSLKPSRLCRHFRGAVVSANNTNAVYRIAYTRDKKTVPILKRILAEHFRGDRFGAFARAYMWAILSIDREKSVPYFLERLQSDGRQAQFALMCLERIAFRRSQNTFADVNLLVREWKTWWERHTQHSWDDLYIAALERRGIMVGSSGVADNIPVDVLLRTWEAIPLRAPERLVSWHWPGFPDEDTLIAMRTSELLAERFPDARISPAGFPFGFPDRSWARETEMVKEDSWPGQLHDWRTYVRTGQDPDAVCTPVPKASND